MVLLLLTLLGVLILAGMIGLLVLVVASELSSKR